MTQPPKDGDPVVICTIIGQIHKPRHIAPPALPVHCIHLAPTPLKGAQRQSFPLAELTVDLSAALETSYCSTPRLCRPANPRPLQLTHRSDLLHRKAMDEIELTRAGQLRPQARVGSGLTFHT